MKKHETGEPKPKSKPKPKKTFPYKGYYDPEKDEYIPDCKLCSGEGWTCFWKDPENPEMHACECNPDKLYPED